MRDESWQASRDFVRPATCVQAVRRTARGRIADVVARVELPPAAWSRSRGSARANPPGAATNGCADNGFTEGLRSRRADRRGNAPARRRRERKGPVMRVAALCDIHGNLPALEAVLQDIRRAGVDRVVV